MDLNLNHNLQIIDKLMSDETARKVALSLAELHPDLFIQMEKAESGWMQKVRSFLAEGKLIQAIKEYRANTLEGLKEAKEACENIRDEMGIVNV